MMGNRLGNRGCIPWEIGVARLRAGMGVQHFSIFQFSKTLVGTPGGAEARKRALDSAPHLDLAVFGNPDCELGTRRGFEPRMDTNTHEFF